MTTGTSLLSFVTCASCDITLQSNLLASACFSARLAHQVIAIRNCPSARMGSTLESHGQRRNGSSAFIKTSGFRRDGTNASQNNSTKQSDGSGRSGSPVFTASAR